MGCCKSSSCCTPQHGIFVLFLFIEAIILVHFGLWISYYAEFNLQAGTNGNLQHYNYKEDIDPASYAHGMLCFMATCIACFDTLEIAQIFYGWYNSYTCSITYGTGCSKVFKWAYFGVFLIFAILLCFGAAKVSLGVTMENDKVKGSMEAINEIYLAYSGLEAIHILSDINIRTVMLVVLLKIKSIWEAPNQTSEENNGTELAQMFKNELLEYHKRGMEVKNLAYPFTLWYLTPWIVFMFSTSINPHYLLAPWTDQYSDIRLFSRIHFLITTAMKIFQLLLQYTFALKMNQYHRDYYMKIKRRMIFKVYEEKDMIMNNIPNLSKDYYVSACPLVDSLEMHDDFNFYPTFLSINPRIAVEGPTYILILLFGVFIKMSDKLMHED